MKLSTVFILTLCQFLCETAEIMSSQFRETLVKDCAAGDLQVSNVQIFATPYELVVTWHAPECGDAEVKYIVEYDNGRTTESVETVVTYHFFDYVANACFEDVVTIKAIANGISGEPVRTIYVGNEEMGEVENLSAKHIDGSVIAEWSPPQGFSDCDLEYIVHVDITDTTITVNNKLHATIEGVNLKACETSVVSVKAKLGDSIPGPEKTTDVQGEISSVTNIIIEDTYGGKARVNYDEPENVQLCNLRYEVIYEPAVCLVRDISISVFDKSGNARTTTTQTIEQKLPAVDNLRIAVISAVRIELRWEPIEILGDCQVDYKLTYELDGNLVWDYGYFSESFLYIDVEPCQGTWEPAETTFSVTPRLGTTHGITTSVKNLVCVDENGMVLDKGLSNNIPIIKK